MTFVGPPGARGTALPHDLTHSPIGLWQFDGDLTDSSGNGFTLSLGAGSTQQFVEMAPGLQGVWFNGTTFYERTSTEATLQVSGPVTMEFIYLPTAPVLDLQMPLSHGAGTANEVDNALYQFSINSDQQPGFFWESVAPRANQANTGAGLIIVPAGIPTHIAATRDGSDHVRFYVNGVQIGATITTSLPAGGGTNGRLRIGTNEFESSTRNVINAGMSSVKIIASALTLAQIEAEYNLTLGPVLGPI